MDTWSLLKSTVNITTITAINITIREKILCSGYLISAKIMI